VYRTTPAGHDFGVKSSYGARTSYATGTSSTGAAHDNDDPDLGLNLDTMVNVLSRLEDAPDLMQPSQTLHGGLAWNPPHRFTLASDAVVHHKRDHRH
jgi:hypothetical protein